MRRNLIQEQGGKVMVVKTALLFICCQKALFGYVIEIEIQGVS